MGTISESILLFMALVSFGFFGYFVGAGLINLDFFYEDLAEPAGDCGLQSMNLDQAAHCLNDELKTFFNYNVDNVGKDLTLEELKAEGGVCSQYSKWYCDQAELLGFECSVVTSIKLKKGISHAVAIMSNHEGYCILDQSMPPHCQAIDVAGVELLLNEQDGKN